MKIKIKTIQNEKILIDTNIWIFLFAPSFIPYNQEKVDQYDEVFNSLKENNEFIFNSIIISEFINTCLRLDFNSKLEFKNKSFKKDYRNSDDYKESLKLILKQVKKIYKMATPINDNFDTYKIQEFQENQENLDFNDSIILSQCKKNNFKLLTDDKDFKNYIEIYWWMG